MNATSSSPDSRSEASFPPVHLLAVLTLVVVVIGGTYVAAYLPAEPPLAPAVGCVIIAAALLALNIVLLARVRPFAWPVFWLVARWSVLAYIVIAGTLEYVFILDHVPGRQLAFLSAMLVVYAVDIPLLFAFSVARYQQPD